MHLRSSMRLTSYPQIERLLGTAAPIAALFANGESGYWPDGYNPAAGRMSQSSFGGAAVSASAQPVSLVLDTSKGTALGPELLINGGFDTDSGWFKGGPGISWFGGRYAIADVAGVDSYISQRIFGTRVGKTYHITLNIPTNTTAFGSAGFRAVLGGSLGATTPYVAFLDALTGVVTLDIQCQFDDAWLVLHVSGTDKQVVIESASCCELLGNSAAQPTAFSRPTLARWPKGGRRNLLTYTEDFGNSVWFKSNIADYAGGFPDPFGGNTAIRFKPIFVTDPGGSARSASLYQATTGIASKVRYSFYFNSIKAVSAYPNPVDQGGVTTTRDVFAQIHNQNNGHVYFNLNTKTVVDSTKAMGVHKAAILDEGSGWFRAYYTAQGTINGNGNTWLSFANRTGQPSFDPYPDGTEEIHIAGVMFEHGSGINLDEPPPTYQKVASVFDVTEAGVPEVWRLTNDGGDSLPATLADGTYTVAWVDALGVVTITPGVIVSTTLDTLRGANQADVLAIKRNLTTAEQIALTAYWERIYA